MSYGEKYVLKDEDFRYIIKFRKANLVNISSKDKRKIMARLRKDSSFLEQNNIMDYSLLLAVETTNGMKLK